MCAGCRTTDYGQRLMTLTSGIEKNGASTMRGQSKIPDANSNTSSQTHSGRNPLLISISIFGVQAGVQTVHIQSRVFESKAQLGSQNRVDRLNPSPG